MTYGIIGYFGHSSLAGVWQPLRLGGGGEVNTVDVAPDGTKVLGADTFGAYIYDNSAGKWQQLCTTDRLPANGLGTATNAGCYEIRIAPSNTNVIYMVYGQFTGAGESYMFVSTDKGLTFTRTPFFKYMPPNAGNQRYYGHHGAVDPINPDVMYIATVSDGVYATANGTSGATSTWSQVNSSGVTAIPSNDGAWNGCIAFDSSNGTTSGKTNNIYISVSGTGLYKSTNAGTSFSLVANIPANTSIKRMKIDSDGTVFMNTYPTNSLNTASPGTLYKLTFPAGVATWTNINPTFGSGYSPESILIDRNNVGHWATFAFGGGFFYTTNAGGHWDQGNIWLQHTTDTRTLALGNMTFTAATGQSNILPNQYVEVGDTRASGGPASFGFGTVVSYNSGTGALVINMTSVGGLLTSTNDWLIYNRGYAYTNTDAPYLACLAPFVGVGAGLGFIEMEIDSANNITAVGAQNVLTASWPPVMDGTWRFTNQVLGIEQLTSRRIITSPNYAPLIISGDIAFIQGSGNKDVSPTKTLYPEGPLCTFSTEGWSADFATSSPSFMAALYGPQSYFGNDKALTSTNGVDFAPTGFDTGAFTIVAGNIAVATPLNYVIAPSNNGTAYYTLNGGATWTAPTIAVSSGSYNNSTGLVTLNLASAPAFPSAGSPGAGTMAVLSGLPSPLNGLQTLASCSGSTITFNAPAGLGLSITTGSVAGSTWGSLATLGGKTPGGGWSYSLFNQGDYHLACDKHPSSVNGSSQGTFYLFNDGFGSDATAKGLYKSVDGGQTWTFYTQTFGGDGVTQIKCPYGAPAAGHVFHASFGYSGGAWSGPDTAKKFRRSTDGGQTWSVILDPSSGFPAICEVWAFGFGAPAPGQSYPAVVIYGFYNSGSGWVHGVFRSIDNCATWQQIGNEYPDKWADLVVDITGDLNTYGTYYISKSGSSYSTIVNI